MSKPIVIAEFALVIPEKGARPEIVYTNKSLAGFIPPEEVDEIFGEVRDLLVKELGKRGVLVGEGVTLQ